MTTLPRLVVPAVLALTACKGDGGATSDTAGTTAATTTAGEALRPNWHEDVAPLVIGSCGGCHVAGGIAPFALTTYAEASPLAALLATTAESGRMPPWHALETDLCQPPHPFKHDPRLSPDEISMLQEWADAGAPEGDPALAAPLPDPPALDLADPTKTVTMASTLTIDKVGSTLDSFHCISLDPAHSGDVYLDGLQVIPGNRAIVHHVLVYVDQNAESASWQGGVKKDCGGGAGLAGPSQLVAGWVPGGMPMEAPAGVGVVLPAGARFVLNVHYHATGGGPEDDSGTGLALRWTTNKPEYTSIATLLGAPAQATQLTAPFLIPAGAEGHVEDFEWVVSVDGQPFPDTIEARLWAITHHMHKVGVDMRTWVVDRDTGEETCILHTPKWDFNWQRSYEYDAPIAQDIRLKAGDTIRLRCIYDNTLQNPSLVGALAEVGLDAPIDVEVGEGTLDEMCIGALGVAIKGI